MESRAVDFGFNAIDNISVQTCPLRCAAAAIVASGLYSPRHIHVVQQWNVAFANPSHASGSGQTRNIRNDVLLATSDNSHEGVRERNHGVYNRVQHIGLDPSECVTASHQYLPGTQAAQTIFPTIFTTFNLSFDNSNIKLKTRQRVSDTSNSRANQDGKVYHNCRPKYAHKKAIPASHVQAARCDSLPPGPVTSLANAHAAAAPCSHPVTLTALNTTLSHPNHTSSIVYKENCANEAATESPNLPLPSPAPFTMISLNDGFVAVNASPAVPCVDAAKKPATPPYGKAICHTHAARSSTTWARSTMRRMPKKNDLRFATSMPCGKRPQHCRVLRQGGGAESVESHLC